MKGKKEKGGKGKGRGRAITTRGCHVGTLHRRQALGFHIQPFSFILS